MRGDGVRLFAVAGVCGGGGGEKSWGRERGEGLVKMGRLVMVKMGLVVVVIMGLVMAVVMMRGKGDDSEDGAGGGDNDKWGLGWR